MEEDRKTTHTANGASQAGSNSPTPEVFPLENDSGSFESLDNLSPRHSIIIPNRIFVGGFDFKVTERDLWNIFCQYGPIREVNIVINRSRMCKGYGFVTFENPEDARKVLLDANGIYIKDKKLSIRQAVRKQHFSGSHFPVFSPDPVPMPCGTVYLTTSSGYPYTFHNGVAYFHSPRVSPAPLRWPAQPAPAVMLPQPCQPVYHQPAYHHYQPPYFPNHSQWNSVESPVGSGPFVYAQPEYLHHVPDGFSSHQPSLPITDDTELYDPVMQQSYSMYPLRAERVPRFVPPHEHGKNHMYSPFQVHPLSAYTYFKDCHCLPEQCEPAEAHPPQSLV